MSSKWIVETPNLGNQDELCIGKIGSMRSSDDPDSKYVSLKYTIIWKANSDDAHKIGDTVQICTYEKLPLDRDYEYFNDLYIEDVKDEKSLEYLAIKSVFLFNHWKI